MTRVPTPLLVAAALTAVLLDVTVAGTPAIAEPNAATSPIPDVVPPTVLDHGLPTTAAVRELRVSSDIAEDGTVEVVLTNPTDGPIEAHLAVDLEHFTGNGVGRMGPMTWSVRHEEIVAELAPGATLRHPLGGVRLDPAALAAQPAPDDAQPRLQVLDRAFPMEIARNQLRVADLESPVHRAVVHVANGPMPQRADGSLMAALP